MTPRMKRSGGSNAPAGIIRFLLGERSTGGRFRRRQAALRAGKLIDDWSSRFFHGQVALRLMLLLKDGKLKHAASLTSG